MHVGACLRVDAGFVNFHVFIDLTRAGKDLMFPSLSHISKESQSAPMEHVISVLVENRFGVLSHISGMFSGRGFNIDSLAVGETEDPSVSRMTIVVQGDDQVVAQILKQLNRQVNVIQVEDLAGREHVERELMLIKIPVTAKNRGELLEVASIFRARVVDVQEESLTIEAVGSGDKLEALLRMCKKFGIRK